MTQEFKMTQAEVKHVLSRAGIVLTKQDGEFRINFRNSKESTAYYTDDLQDAYQTAIAMKLD